jgi:capsular polysaccharide biosynthesis protein
MSLTDYFRLLRRRGWILIVMAALTAASAYVFSKVQTEVWKSSIFIGIQPTRPDFGLTESAKKLLRYYVAVITTKTYAQKVIDELQLDVTAEGLLGQATIASDDSRFVVQIDVKNEDPALADAIAQQWAIALVDWRNAENAKIRREDQVDALILDPPRPSLDRPKTTINVLAGAILGFLLGGIVIFVLEYIESNVMRSPQDIERVLSLSVLGVIPPAETRARPLGNRHA